MSLLEDYVSKSSWWRLLPGKEYGEISGLKYRTELALKESYSTSVEMEAKALGVRSDTVIFIPIIRIEDGESLTLTNRSHLTVFKDSCETLYSPLLDASFLEYVDARVPMPLEPFVRMEKEVSFSEEHLEIQVGKVCFKLDLDDPVAMLFKNFGELSLAFSKGGRDFFARFSRCSDLSFPVFAQYTGSVLNVRNEERRLQKLPPLDKLEGIAQIGREMYLGMPYSSDYECYQSTEDSDSLPRVPKLGEQCWACGKEGKLTVEHCSPKWLADKYRVKPLTAPIFCKECNGYFGEFFENPVKQALEGADTGKVEISVGILAGWLVKTALTMSLASGVMIDPLWLNMLRHGLMPEGFEVYFDTSVTIPNHGFNYGVSQLSTQIEKRGGFLFGIVTSDFAALVLRNSRVQLEVPLDMIYPNRERKSNGPSLQAFPDIYENIHVQFTGEGTVNYSLPIKKQTRK